MFFEKVEFPDSLLDAQRDKSLVVFAGAGVSIGAPANYPNFAQLAEQVASGALERKENEPIDLFLGRLEQQGVQVHRRTCELLSNPSSKPNPLHFELLKLFPCASKVRLVTTNFDLHFNTAASSLWNNSVDISYAPTLPLGNDFNGIVYLHGSVLKEERRIVITDRDFGRAYLTQGWASRFLQDMFSEYTILFIGYSYNDPVVPYLTRGLPPNRPGLRFTLVKEDDDPERWQYLGITPIIYPLQDGADRHKALGEAIATWVQHIQMGALDHEHRIREIVELPPPLELNDLSYIKNALKDLVKVRFFTRYAITPEWLCWAEGQGVFQELFQLNLPVSEISQEIASWFSYFVCQYPDEALALTQRQGQILNPILWNAIAHRLSLHDLRPTSETIAKWIVVLLHTAQFQFSSYYLDYLLNDCQYPDDNLTAVLLFEYLIKPRIDLKQGFSEISVIGETYWLNEAWQKLFKPNLAAFAERLEPILSHHLQQAYLLLKSLGKANEIWCHIGYKRSAIEPHEQDRFRDKMDNLIDAARDVLEWLLENRAEHGHGVIDAWSNSEMLILKRLAIHGVIESSRFTPDEKIDWLLKKDWIDTYGLKHEVFRLLKNAYPKSSDASRLHLLERVEQSSEQEDSQNLEPETQENLYEIYNLLSWLHQATPDCSLLTQRLEAIQQTYPYFSPRECPDFYFWISSRAGREVSRSVTVEELLAKNPQEELDWFLNHREEDSFGLGRSHFLDKVREAVARSFEWSWQLVQVLKSKEDWNADIWREIFLGWQQCHFTDKQWEDVLNFLNAQPQLYEFASYITDILLQNARQQQNQIPSSCLPLAENLAEQLWLVCNSDSTNRVTEAQDWYSKAINHPGGRIVEFWLRVLSRKREETKESWNGIPSQFKNYFQKVLIETSYTAELGKVFIAGQLHFLFAVDAEWTRKNVLPLLDWNNNLKQAQQAWHGFLSMGRWNEEMLPDLLPLYEQTFTHLAIGIGNTTWQDHFSDHIASIAVYSSRNLLQEGWIGRFVKTISSKERKRWADHICRLLQSMKEDAARNLWERWLKEYWQQRITGVPLRLEAGELEEMLKWSIHLKPVFPEVVEKICQSPVYNLNELDYFYHILSQKSYVSSHPEALTQLLLYLLSESKQFFSCREIEVLIRDLVNTTAPRNELKQICHHLSRLGCQNAADLHKLVEKKFE